MWREHKQPSNPAKKLSLKEQSMQKAKCPNCRYIIHFNEKIRVQDLKKCGNCGLVFEVVSLFPVKLDWIEDPVVFFPRISSKKLY
jgi:hypothetical protein